MSILFIIINKMEKYILWNITTLSFAKQICDTLSQYAYFRKYFHSIFPLNILSSTNGYYIQSYLDQFTKTFLSFCSFSNTDIYEDIHMWEGVSILFRQLIHRFPQKYMEPSNLTHHHAVAHLECILNIDYDWCLYIFLMVMRISKQMKDYKWFPQHLMCEADTVNNLTEYDYRLLGVFRKNKILLSNLCVCVGYEIKKILNHHTSLENWAVVENFEEFETIINSIYTQTLLSII